MEATATEPKYMSFEEMKEAFPNEWVILGDPKEKGIKILGGYVLFHHPNQTEAAYRGRDLTKGFSFYTWVYTGEFEKVARLGLFRKVTLPQDEKQV